MFLTNNIIESCQQNEKLKQSVLLYASFLAIQNAATEESANGFVIKISDIFPSKRNRQF